MFRAVSAAFARSEADKLAAVLDAQRAEQRNAESLLSRLWESRDVLMSRGQEEARSRIDALDRDIAFAAERVRRALKLQTDVLLRLAGREGLPFAR